MLTQFYATIIIIIYIYTDTMNITHGVSMSIATILIKEENINSFRLKKLNQVMKFLMIYGSASKKEGVRLQGRSCDDILSP